MSHDGHATGSGSRAGGRAAPKAGAAPKVQPASETTGADDLIGDDLAAQLQQVLDEARQELDLDLSGSPQSKQAEAERQSLSGNSVNPFAPPAESTQDEDDREDAGVEPTTIDAADQAPIVTDSAANAVEAFESLDEILANVAADLAADEVTQPATDAIRTEPEASANPPVVAAEAPAAVANQPAAIATANQPASEEPVVEVDDLERQLQELLAQAATGAEDDHSISSPPASSVLPELDATTIKAQAVTDEIRQMSELIDQVVSQQADDAAAATPVIDATVPTNESASGANPAAAPMTVLDDDDMAAQIARLMEEHSAAMRGETLPPAPKPAAPAAVPAPPVQPAVAGAPVVPAAPMAAAPVAATPSVAAPIAAAPELKPSAAASQTSAPGESLHQLDEFLAGHADHAVADEFETINDVIAQRDATAQGAAMSESASSHDAAAQAATEATLHEEFATPAQMLGQPATAMSPSRQPATTAATAATTTAATATATATTTATTGASNPAASQRLANLLRTTGRIVIVCKTAAFKACSVLNRPVRNASESTRKIIGYAGLITLGNATFLLLGKLLNILG